MSSIGTESPLPQKVRGAGSNKKANKHTANIQMVELDDIFIGVSLST